MSASRTLNYLKMTLNERRELNFDDDITFENFNEFHTKRAQSRVFQTFCLLLAKKTVQFHELIILPQVFFV